MKNACIHGSVLKSVPKVDSIIRTSLSAAMASGGREEIEDLLEKLHHCTSGNHIRNARNARDIVVDISEHLSKDLSPVQYGKFFPEVGCPRRRVGSHVAVV